MAFIEKADGTIIDTDIITYREEKMKEKEKDAEYEKYMNKVREGAASSGGKWDPFQIF